MFKKIRAKERGEGRKITKAQLNAAPALKKKWYDKTTSLKSATQIKAEQTQKKLFHGLNAFKLQETARKATAYTELLKTKQANVEKKREEAGTIGQAKGMFSWGRTKEQKALKSAESNLSYLKKKQSSYNKKSTGLLAQLQAASSKKIAAETASGKKTNTTNLAGKTTLANALSSIKTGYNTKMKEKQQVRQEKVDTLQKLVVQKQEVDTKLTKATKDYYDARKTGKKIMSSNGTKELSIAELKTIMQAAEVDKKAFDSSPKGKEIETLAKTLKTQKKIEFIKSNQLFNVARGSVQGQVFKDEAKKEAFTSTLNVRQARANARKGTLKKLEKYASPDGQKLLASRIAESDKLLAEKKSTYTKEERKIIKGGLKAKSVFGALSRTGVPLLVEEGDKQKIQGIINASQAKREVLLTKYGTNIATNKFKRADNTLKSVEESKKLFRFKSTKNKQVVAAQEALKQSGLNLRKTANTQAEKVKALTPDEIKTLASLKEEQKTVDELIKIDPTYKLTAEDVERTKTMAEIEQKEKDYTTAQVKKAEATETVASTAQKQLMTASTKLTAAETKLQKAQNNKSFLGKFTRIAPLKAKVTATTNATRKASESVINITTQQLKNTQTPENIKDSLSLIKESAETKLSQLPEVASKTQTPPITKLEAQSVEQQKLTTAEAAAKTQANEAQKTQALEAQKQATEVQKTSLQQQLKTQQTERKRTRLEDLEKLQSNQVILRSTTPNVLVSPTEKARILEIAQLTKELTPIVPPKSQSEQAKLRELQEQAAPPKLGLGDGSSV
jgi:hypothetical protein